MSSEAVEKIKKLERRVCGHFVLVERRAFWILCYCYFVNGKDEVIHWKQLEQSGLMGNDRLSVHLSNLTAGKYLKNYDTGSETFYKLTPKAKQLMEQQLKEAEILLELRCGV